MYTCMHACYQYTVLRIIIIIIHTNSELTYSINTGIVMDTHAHRMATKMIFKVCFVTVYGIDSEKVSVFNAE